MYVPYTYGSETWSRLACREFSDQSRLSAGACKSKRPPRWPWCPSNIDGRISYCFPVVPAWTAHRRLGVIRSKLPRATEPRSARRMRPHIVRLTGPGIPELNLQNNRSAKCQGSVGLILGISRDSVNTKQHEFRRPNKGYSVSLVLHVRIGGELDFFDI